LFIEKAEIKNSKGYFKNEMIFGMHFPVFLKIPLYMFIVSALCHLIRTRRRGSNKRQGLVNVEKRRCGRWWGRYSVATSSRSTLVL